MSISRFGLLMAVMAGCGTGVSAEQLLPDHLRQLTDPNAVSQASSVFTQTFMAAGGEPATYLDEATAAAPDLQNALAGAPLPSGRWSPTSASASVAGEAETYSLIEALNALGPIGVSVADYLALAVPGLDTRSAGSSGPTPGEAVKPRSTGMPAPADGLAPAVSSIQAHTAVAEPTERWALPTAASEEFTRYLLAAAALAILAGAGLRLLVLTRRHAAPWLARR